MIRFVLFFLMAVLNVGLAEKDCKEEDLRDCLGNLQHSVIDHFHDLAKINKDKYCQDVDKGKQCMDNALEKCHDKYSHLSYLISSFYVYLNQICTEKGKIYMDIAPCLQHHKSEFDKCEFDDKEQSDPMDEICKETEHLKCVASIAQKVCDKGESFGRAVEEHVAKFHWNVCYNNSVSANTSVNTCAMSYLGLAFMFVCLCLTKH